MYFKPILGSNKLTREVEETIMINEFGGLTETANKVLPVSKARNIKLNLGITNYK